MENLNSSFKLHFESWLSRERTSLLVCGGCKTVCTYFMPCIDLGAVGAGYCGSPSAIDRNVLWWRQLTEGAGQSEEGTCLRSVWQHWCTEGKSDATTQKDNVVLHISLIKPHTRKLTDACLAVRGQHYYSSCCFSPFLAFFEKHCVLLW